jgi:ubiquinone/menaquinone biosynthesis C-methylase UbiE
MNDVSEYGSFDPYRPFKQSLKSGDAINRWLLLQPRQKIAQLLKGQRVLDVCCGTGNLTAMLAAAGCRVTGIDSSPTMLSYARRKQIAAEYKQMDATKLPFDCEYDAAIISLALHEMSPGIRGQVWASMCAAIRPGGRLVAMDFTVPKRSNLLASLLSGLVEQDEREMLKIHAEHYQNFREFMNSGGVTAWMRKQDQPVEAEYRYWSGNVAVVIARQADKEIEVIK